MSGFYEETELRIFKVKYKGSGEPDFNENSPLNTTYELVDENDEVVKSAHSLNELLND